ncbi:agmatine deiminase family protein [Algisphaera agarilytica]|uniref:Agmatine deiminase n=1 Tax=Algisphaera agarilytica TaxID=1385975 RepID=A0A7X0H8E5_9BACT|nr:agmatine deiminase family protein [Algisphaera agarilytica]MBB6429714.1 agmatine deiminase [Algisphaera agarilytica]
MASPPPPEHVSFRWPAEWEPLEAVWVVPPHNPETWPGCLDKAQAEHAAWCKAMAEVVRVRTTDELGIATNDSWIRDFGPLFVWRDEAGSPPLREGLGQGEGAEHSSDLLRQAAADGELRHPHPSPLPQGRGGQTTMPQLVIQDFRFNGWGDKYETRALDDAVSGKLAEALGLPIVKHDQVLEGGALETDGRGTLLTTTDCLLNPSRNGPTDRDTMEQLLNDALGITRTIWLSAQLPGDDTDGHIDNAARFVSPDSVVVHPAIDTTPLRDAGLNVIELPAVDPIFYDYPGDRFGPAQRMQLPCSYANFLIANGRIFVPTFGQPADDRALRLLDDAMPNHTPVPIRSNHLVVGQGALHCLSMQQPAASS